MEVLSRGLSSPCQATLVDDSARDVFDKDSHLLINSAC